jgi:hypothetical protein
MKLPCRHCSTEFEHPLQSVVEKFRARHEDVIHDIKVPTAATISPPSARARTTDPQTSHDAADRVNSEGSTEMKRHILEILRDGERSDEELQEAYEFRHGEVSPSGLRSRRSELVKEDHLVEASPGKTATTRTGSSAIVWRLVKA